MPLGGFGIERPPNVAWVTISRKRIVGRGVNRRTPSSALGPTPSARSVAPACRELPQRRDVIQDPVRTPVRGRHHVAVLQFEVAHRRDRQVEAQRVPALPVVEAHPHAAPLRTGVEQPGLLRVLAHDPHEIVLREPRVDAAPRRPVVCGCPYGRRVVRPSCGGWRRRRPTAGSCREGSTTLTHVSASMSGGVTSSQFPPPSRETVHEAFVRPGPQDAFPQGRLGDAGDCGIPLDPHVLPRKTPELATIGG